MKCRKRLDEMTDTEKRLEQYKNNDWQAKTVELKKLHETLAYKNASSDEKQRLKEQTRMTVMKNQ